MFKVYTQENCPNCEDLKAQALLKLGIMIQYIMLDCYK